MEIKQNNYQVVYNDAEHTVVCAGSFRLTGSEYVEISEILNAAADAKPETLTLDVTQLQFLNSSGINTLSKFVIRVRKLNASQIVVKGSNDYTWQKKSLINLQRLLPNLVLELA